MSTPPNPLTPDKTRIFSSPILALGDIYTPDGVLHKPVDGVVARLKGSCRWIHRYAGLNDPTLFFASAGYARPNKWTSQLYPWQGRPVSLACQLKRYLVEHYSDDDDLIIPSVKLQAKPLCWSTRSEIRLGVKRTQAWMKEHEFEDKECEVILVVASHWAHVPRILMYCWWYVPRSWGFKLLCVKHVFSLRSHLSEPLKLQRDLIRWLRTLFRLRRMKKWRKKKMAARAAHTPIPRGYGKY
jgi:hypothetical protein